MKEFYRSSGIVIYNDDNLEVLQNIPNNSVNLIYCDILYNTGKVFDDYNDNLGNPYQALAWYRPRIQQMKRVLTANGSIFLHCNWRLDSYIRILMDEIFTVECFRNRIYRKHSNERGFYKNFDSQVDTILYYVKDSHNFVFNEITEHQAHLVPIFENGFLEGRSETRYTTDGTAINLKKYNKHWLISLKEFDILLKKNELRLIDNLPYRFSNVKALGNLWSSPDMLDTYSRIALSDAYDTPKPEAVLNTIISICSNKGDTVADFFLGGGTTAVVTKKLHRKGIFCDISQKACSVTVQKLKDI